MLDKINFDRRYLDSTFIQNVDKGDIKNKTLELNNQIDGLLRELEHKKDAELEAFADSAISLFLQSYCSMYGMTVNKTKKDYIVSFNYDNADIGNGTIIDPNDMQNMSKDMLDKMNTYIDKKFKKKSLRAKESKKFLKQLQNANNMLLNGLVNKTSVKFSKKEFSAVFTFCNLV